MNIDLSNLTAGEIALLTIGATLLAAVTGASAALVAAIIKARNARWLARYEARREYRQAALDDLLKVSDASFADFASVYRALENADVDAAAKRIREMANTPLLFRSIAFTTVVTADEIVNHSAQQFAEAYNQALSKVSETLGRMNVGGPPLESGAALAELDAIFDSSYNLRQAAEDFIVGSKGNIKRLRKIRRLKDRIRELNELRTLLDQDGKSSPQN